MKNIFRKSISLLLTLCVLLSVILSAPFTVMAADTNEVKVEIVSFMRGSQKDLRSSELLEARLTGYDGNPQELIYEWTNTLGTYLYVYNSHNMYYINGTDGEVEVYNSKINSSTNMAGRTYKDTFSGEGYCWAAIYGSNKGGSGQSITNANAYTGTISVTVKDKAGNIIGSDSHTGKATTSGMLWWQTTTYDGILDHNLQSDMDNVTIGMFEGDERNVKDLLGESAILHITCVESDVANGSIASGSDKISLTKKSDGDYYITGVKAGTSTDTSGDAKVNLSIQKNTCKFHSDSSGTAVTTVYVFKKPTTSTTAYTLTLTGNLDSRCSYYIYGREGVKQPDGTILFDGLTPNTTYPVEVRGEYRDENGNTKYAYAYVYDTTKPIYTGTVEVYLNGTYDSATHTASGTKVDISDVTEHTKLYAKAEGSDEYIELTHTAKGTYSSILDTGNYHLYYDKSEDAKVDEQFLTMNNADRTRYIFYNTVNYIVDGEDYSDSTELTGSSVDIINNVPTKEGYVFVGWKDKQDNRIYSTNELLTSGIARPHVLVAQWAEGVDVYVNIDIEHRLSNYSHDFAADRHNVSFDLMSRPQGASGDYADVFDAPISINWNGTDTFSSDIFEASRTETATEDITHYDAKVPVLKNTIGGYDYSVEIAKSNYSIKSVTQTVRDNGDIVVDVVLTFDPTNADLKFEVELDDEAKELVKKHPEYKPSAVHVKVTSHFRKNNNAPDWFIITQHDETFVTLYLDENGRAQGSYPVWAVGEFQTIYYYRIAIVSYVLPDGRIIPVENLDNVTYITADDRYTAKVSVNGGACPNGSVLNGAHFSKEDNSYVQNGDIKGIISISTHTVTFEPDGGKFTSDNSTDNKVANKQIEVPALSDYTVTRDGGYVFMGWYLVDENDNTTNTQIFGGEDLTEDITVRAVWKAPVAVEGTIYIAGYYYMDGVDVNMPKDSMAEHITIYLQKLLPNGYAETISEQKVHVDYSEGEKPMGAAQYSFAGLPDDGHQYRVLIQNPNYTVRYQNEPESIDADKVTDFKNYYKLETESDDFMAYFGETEPDIADVNVFMQFTPQVFDLNYKVDATKIGEGFRPSISEVLILFKDSSSSDNPQTWPVITQLTKGDVINGIDTSMSAQGIGLDSYHVWNTTYDGHTLYDYGVLLQSITVNDKIKEYNASTAPFYVFYNGSARYSALNGQSQLLTIELQPRRYKVTFDLNFAETENDYVTGMDKYYVGINGTKRNFEVLHLWSYETDFSDAVPVREGYRFLGWYDENGNKVTSVAADVAKDTVVTAKWEKQFKVTFHANNDDINYDVFRTYYESDATIPEGENNYSLNENNTLNSFYDIPQFEYYTHNKYVFKGWYLDKDSDARPINFNEVYTEDTDVYAHWILVNDVAQEEGDEKIVPNGTYKGFDLVGVQIRDIEKDDVDHYGKPGTGLRFITVLSEDVYSQINALSSKNANGAEYGFVMAKTSTTDTNANGKDGYTLQYVSSNTNGVDTNEAYYYVKNMKCSGVPDHYNGTAYRLYTAVVTYSKTGDALEAAHAQKMSARSYIRYTDANGLERVHYNNYTGTNVYAGCSASFNDAYTLLSR